MLEMILCEGFLSTRPRNLVRMSPSLMDKGYTSPSTGAQAPLGNVHLLVGRQGKAEFVGTKKSLLMMVLSPGIQ